MSVIIQGSGGVTTNSGAVYDGISRGTSVTASGTSVDFTGIPSWVKRITVMFAGVSTNGTSVPLIQIGDSGGIETTGYLGATSYFSFTAAASINSTTGVRLDNGADSASNIRQGHIVICNLTGNTWTFSGSVGLSDTTRSCFVSYSKPLSDVLTQVRITTVNGTDTFDAGSINILFE